jgi:hypothetical protein
VLKHCRLWHADAVEEWGEHMQRASRTTAQRPLLVQASSGRCLLEECPVAKRRCEA